MSAPVVRVRDLRVDIAGSSIDIVDEIAFDIEEGEVLGLVGESGSGKTTVGLALLGHCRRGAAIHGGSVVIGGQDLLRLDPKARHTARGKRVAYIPQDPSTSSRYIRRSGFGSPRRCSRHFRIRSSGPHGGSHSASPCRVSCAPRR